MSSLPYDRAHVGVAFEFQGVKYKPSQWIDGSLVRVGDDVLRFQSKDLVLFDPDHFDRFDLDARTIRDTLSQDLGEAADRGTAHESSDDDTTQGPKNYIPGFDLARVRIDCEFGGFKYQRGDWITGIFASDGAKLKFLTRDIVSIIPDYFDRFDIAASVIRDTFGQNLAVK